MSTSIPLTIVAITRALAGKEQLLRSAQEKLVAETVQEPGCCVTNSVNHWMIPAC
jgi:quinol monooxygenase YgiN